MTAPGTIQTATSVEKQQFENQSGGFVGAVQIDATGKPSGVAVAPGGRVWLSHAEQVLTANAPQDPRHNPFLSQVFQQIDPETGDRRDVEVTPLKAVTDQRYVPASERFVPAEQPESEPSVESSPEPTKVETETPAAPPAEPPAPSARAQAAAEAAAGTETAQEGEETGAAVPPAQDAEKGQYAPGEEVGTPEAPAAAPAEGEQAATPAGPPAPPAPWTPGSTA